MNTKLNAIHFINITEDKYSGKNSKKQELTEEKIAIIAALEAYKEEYNRLRLPK